MADRAISVTTSLGEDALVFRRMVGREQLGRPFKFVIDLLADDEQFILESVLGLPITVGLELADESERYFNGLVSDFSLVGRDGRYAHYQATVRPWLWFLSRSSDCRIFQNMTVPDIIKLVCMDHGFSDIEDELSEAYAEREFCVQYRETAFDFISRLMEDEGIYYYFAHEADKHSLVLCDSYGSHAPVEGYEEIRYLPPAADARDNEHVSEWRLAQGVQPGGLALSDYDFTRPRAGLGVKSSVARGGGMASFELYDYPGGYSDADLGERSARLRIEGLHAQFERIHAVGNARGIQPGALFSLTEFPREDQNREYLIARADYELEESVRETGEPASGPTFRSEFQVLESQTPFRSSHHTERPTVRGPQTALVVGKEGEKIWTDEYGRVKVQFHWDRYGEADENSSCWVRVSQAWAGKQWGAMFIPHVGQEVIVDFLEGDPDRPLITGRVYNADNLPPLALSEGQHKSIIRDDYGNEIIFDGTPDDEHIEIRSPHYESALILGRSTQLVTTSTDWVRTMGDTKSERYGDSLSFTYGFSHGFTFGGSTSVFVGASASLWIGGSLDVTVGSKLSLSLVSSVDLSKGNKFSSFWGNEYSAGSRNFVKSVDKNVILDANQVLQLIAGEKNESILHGDAKKIVIDYGVGEDAEWDDDWSVAKKYALTTGLGLAAAVAGAVAIDGGSALAVKDKWTSESAATPLTQAEVDQLKAVYDAAVAANPNWRTDYEQASQQTYLKKSQYDSEKATADSALSTAETDWRAVPPVPPATTPPTSGAEYVAYQSAATEAAKYAAPDASTTPAVAAGAKYTELVVDPATHEAAKKAIYLDVKYKKEAWELAKAMSERATAADYSTAVVGGAVMLAGLIGMWFAAKRLGAKAHEPFDLDSRTENKARITLDEGGVFIESYTGNAIKSSMMVDNEGNIKFAGAGKLEMHMDKDIHFYTKKTLFFSADKIKVSTTKLSSNAAATLDAGRGAAPPTPAKAHKLVKYTPPADLAAAAAKKAKAKGP